MAASASITSWVLRGSSDGNRFVSQDNFGPLHQRAADGDALLLAAGQLVAALGGRSRPCQSGPSVSKAASLSASVQAVSSARQVGTDGQAPHQHIGQDVQTPHQIELLEHHGAVPTPFAQGAPFQRGDHRAVVQDAALGRLVQAVQQAQQGGLTRPGAAYNADKCTSLRPVRTFIQRHGMAKMLAQVLDDEGGHGEE
jgi:hypothetical protein